METNGWCSLGVVGGVLERAGAAAVGGGVVRDLYTPTGAWLLAPTS